MARYSNLVYIQNIMAWTCTWCIVSTHV